MPGPGVIVFSNILIIEPFQGVALPFARHGPVAPRFIHPYFPFTGVRVQLEVYEVGSACLPWGCHVWDAMSPKFSMINVSKG